MALLGGAFESTSSTQTTTTTQNAGFSETGGAAISLNVTGGGKRSTVTPTVNILDGGAVKAAIDATKYGLDNALDFANTTTTAVIDANVDVIKSALDNAHGAYSDALHVTQSALDNLTLTQGNALDSVTALAAKTSASESDRISKLAGWALLAVAALVIVPKVFAK